MMKKQAIAALILTMLLSQSLVSCSDTGKTADKAPQSSGNTDEAQTQAEPTYLDTLPAGLSYEGDNFHIAWSSPVDVNECAVTLSEIEGGDIVNEAVFNRNRMVEELLGITITAEKLCSWTDILTTVRKLSESGDNPFDAYCFSVWFAFQCSVNGFLTDLADIETLDLTNRWWDPITTEMHRLGSKTAYFVNGDINYVDDLGTCCIFFNKDMASTYQIPDLYELVKNGEWTYDAMYNIAKQVSSDTDGDGKYTEKDIFGFSDNTAALTRLLAGFGENVVVIDETGTASINTSERVQSIVGELVEGLLGRQTVSTAIRGRSGIPEQDMFSGGQCLLYPGEVSQINRYRDSMEADFGIIPSPKYDENQKSYYSLYSTAWATAYSVPISNTEYDKTGYILDVMGYFSHDTIYEAVIEKSVLVKAVRDENSTEMLDIIFNSRFFELGQWGTKAYGKTNEIVTNATNTYASMAKSLQKVTEKEFAKIKDYYEY